MSSRDHSDELDRLLADQETTMADYSYIARHSQVGSDKAEQLLQDYDSENGTNLADQAQISTERHGRGWIDDGKLVAGCNYTSIHFNEEPPEDFAEFARGYSFDLVDEVEIDLDHS